jgi:4'-phosphopantetheinyl transferase
VWWAKPRADPSLIDLLDDTERRAVSRLTRDEDRERYVTAHALVRLLSADRIGVPADTLRFDRPCRQCGEAHGKPRLARTERAADAPPIAFNLAHAGDRIVVALVTGDHLDIGVDVERILAPDAPALATVGPDILSEAELSAYLRLSPRLRGEALAVWWTRKEAVLKATGDGLAVPPSDIEVTAPHLDPALTGPGLPKGTRNRVPSGSVLDDGARISLRSLDAGPGYVGCVAVLGATSVEVTEHDAGPILGTS